MNNEMNPDGILCAIDANDFDQDVIDLAATFCLHANKDLDLLHVTLFPNPMDAAWPAYTGSPNVIIQVDKRFQKITTSVDGVTVRHHHLSGIPGNEILQFVERNKPQLLVIGTRGRRGLAGIFGSVASKILRHATCPVMVLRQRKNSQDFADLKEKTI